MTRPTDSAARPGEARLRPIAAAIAAFGGWAITVPYLGSAAGLELDVPARVEFVDHVVPGVVAVAAAAWLLAAARDGEPTLAALVAAGACVLAGFWISATHLTLLIDAARGAAPAGASLLHGTAGPALLAVSAWLLARLMRAPD